MTKAVNVFWSLFWRMELAFYNYFVEKVDRLYFYNLRIFLEFHWIFNITKWLNLLKLSKALWPCMCTLQNVLRSCKRISKCTWNIKRIAKTTFKAVDLRLQCNFSISKRVIQTFYLIQHFLSRKIVLTTKTKKRLSKS